MQAAVADTGPLNYLILIEAVEVLPRLFSPISIPAGVKDELSHPKAPPVVCSWISDLLHFPWERSSNGWQDYRAESGDSEW
jgi:hypothetical protein